MLPIAFHNCLLLLTISLTGCGFHHDMPVRKAFDRVQFGEPLPAELNQPIDATHPDNAHLRGVSAEHEWEHSTGAREWALFLLDDDQRVIAKRYQVRGEEATMPTLQFKRLDASEWHISRDCIEVPDEISAVKSACDRLQFEGTDLPLGEMDLMRFDPAPREGPIAADELLSSLAASRRLFDELPPWAFNKSQRLECQWPAHGQARWSAQRDKNGAVKLRVENRIDVSLASWAAAGYAYIFTHGGELPDG